MTNALELFPQLLEDFFLMLIPTTYTAIGWWALGGTFARSFGKNLDHNVQELKEFKNLHWALQWIIKFILNFTHHWWIGFIIMLMYVRDTVYPWNGIPIEWYWFGAGILVDDLPDLYRRVKEMIDTIRQYMNSNEKPPI